MTSTVFKARDVGDLIACVPPVLGFEPTESLVMLTTGPNQFHARIDLPESSATWEGLARVLLKPCHVHGVEGVVFLIYSEDPDLDFGDFLDSAWTNAAIEVHEVVFVKGDNYLAVQNGVSTRVNYRLADHRITLQAAYADHAPLDESREAMVERVRPGAAEVIYSDDTDIPTSRDISVSDLREHLSNGMGLPEIGITGVVKALTDPIWSSDLVSQTEQTEADRMLVFWTEVLRSTQPGSRYAYKAAELAAYFAWWSGHGAIAWACLDHTDQESRFAAMLSTVLTNAVNPNTWNPKDGSAVASPSHH